MDIKALQERWTEFLTLDQLERGDPSKSISKLTSDSLTLFQATKQASSNEQQISSTESSTFSKEEHSRFPDQTEAYELIEEIGRGGMGVIFRARQKSLAREVAIKKILEHRQTSLEDKFINEAQVTASLNHPNIVPVHDLCEDNNREIMLAMKEVKGKNWRSILQSQKGENSKAYDSKQLNENLRILISICHGLAFAHSRGIAHLDLKPENVMIGDFGEILIMDWGLAVDFRDFSDDNSINHAVHKSKIENPLGTPCYMAPELANGDGLSLGPQTDVYLLGAILHELLTGRPPHSGSKLIFVLMSALKAETPKFPEDTPKELQAIATKALSRFIKDRYQSVLEFQAVLQNYLKHSESLLVAQRANSLLDYCVKASSVELSDKQQIQVYEDYASAIAGFRNALVLWPKNEAATNGEQIARLAYAKAALKSGDFGLAETQWEQLSSSSKKSELGSQIIAVKQKRANLVRSAKRVRVTLLATAITVFLTVLAGLYFVNQQKERALLAEKEQRRQKEVISSEKRNVQQQKTRADNEALSARISTIETKSQLIESKLFEAWNGKDNPKKPYNERMEALVNLAGHIDQCRSEFPDKKNTRIQRVEERLREYSGSLMNLLQLQLSESILGQEILFGDPMGSLQGVYLSPNERELLVASTSGVLVTFDLESGKVLTSFDRHSGNVLGARFSKDGRWILSYSSDKTLNLWDRKTGKLIHRIDHRSNIDSCAFSGDSQSFMSYSDHKIQVWDLKSAKLRKQIRFIEPFVAADLSPDGEKLALSLQGAPLLVVFDINTRKKLMNYRPALSLQKQEFKDVKFSHSGKSLIVMKTRNISTINLETGLWNFQLAGGTFTDGFLSTDGSSFLSYDAEYGLRLQNTDNREEIQSFPKHRIGSIQSCVISTKLNVCVLLDSSNHLSIWDINTGQVLKNRIYQRDQPTACQFSPDNRHLLFGYQSGLLKLWDREDKRFVRTFRGHKKEISTCLFSPSGRFCVSASIDGEIIRWDLESDTFQKFLGHKDAVTSLAISAGSQTLLSTSRDKTLVLRNLRTGAITQTIVHESPVITGDFCLNGNGVISLAVGRPVQLWDRTGQLLRRFQTPRASFVKVSPCSHFICIFDSGYITFWLVDSGEKIGYVSGGFKDTIGCAFRPRGDQYIVWQSGKSIRVFFSGVKDRLLRDYASLFTGIKACALSCSGQEMLAILRNGTARIVALDPKPRFRKYNGHLDVISDCAISPNKKQILTASNDKNLILWDRSSQKEIRRFIGHYRSITSCIFTPEGEQVISTSEDHDLRIWDIHTGTTLKTLRGHRSSVLSSSITLEGDKIASGSSNGFVILWNRHTGQKIKRFRAHKGSVEHCVFSTDAKLLLTGSEDGEILLWDVKSCTKIKRFAGHTEKVISLSFLPDGKRIWSTSEDKSIRVWSIKTTKSEVTINLKNHIYRAALAPNGSECAIEVGKVIQIWSLKEKSLTKTLKCYDNNLVSYTPEGLGLVFVDATTARIIDFHSRSTQNYRSKIGYFHPCFGFRSQQREAVFYSFQRLEFRDIDTGTLKRVIKLRASPSSMTLTPNGSHILVEFDHRLEYWNCDTLQLTSSFKTTQSIDHFGFSKNGNRLSTLEQVKQKFQKTYVLNCWDTNTGKLIRSTVPSVEDGICCAWSPDGEVVAIASSTGTEKVFQSKTGELLYTIDSSAESNYLIQFSPVQREFITVSRFGKVKRWDTRTGQLLRNYGSVTSTERRVVLDAGFARDGQEFYILSGDTLKCFDVLTGSLLSSIQIFTKRLQFKGKRIHFSKDGNTILATDTSGNLMVYKSNPYSCKELLQDSYSLKGAIKSAIHRAKVYGSPYLPEYDKIQPFTAAR